MRKFTETNLSLTLLENFFGDGWFWHSLGAELVGFNKDKNQLIVIDDGRCFSDSWLYTIYDFAKCEETAMEWALKNWKYPVEYAEALEQEWMAYVDNDGLVKTTARELDEIYFATHPEEND